MQNLGNRVLQKTSNSSYESVCQLPEVNDDGSYGCRQCGARLTNLNAFNCHRYRLHGIVKRTLACPYERCLEAFPSIQSLKNHLVGTHNVALEKHQFHFSSESQFLAWRGKLEHLTNTSFIRINGRKTEGDLVRENLYCRAAYPTATNPAILTKRSEESLKANAVCPAHISSIIYPDGSVKVDCQLRHLGHGAEEEMHTDGLRTAIEFGKRIGLRSPPKTHYDRRKRKWVLVEPSLLFPSDPEDARAIVVGRTVDVSSQPIDETDYRQTSKQCRRNYDVRHGQDANIYLSKTAELDRFRCRELSIDELNETMESARLVLRSLNIADVEDAEWESLEQKRRCAVAALEAFVIAAAEVSEKCSSSGLEIFDYGQEHEVETGDGEVPEERAILDVPCVACSGFLYTDQKIRQCLLCNSFLHLNCVHRCTSAPSNSSSCL